MSLQPSVSIVVPFFNSEHHIAACIESLLAQENVDGSFEILLINNGSADQSPDIVERFVQKYAERFEEPSGGGSCARLTVLAESKPGAYAARNTGIQDAKAPLIALTDADCTADPDWLQSIQHGMQNLEVGVLLGHCRYPDHASLALRALGAYENAKTAYVVERCTPAHHFAYANNMAVRASIFEELGPFKEWKRAADSEFVHRLAASASPHRLAFRRAMKITHLEFVEARERARRLSLYTQTNSQIPDFQELNLAQRLGMLRHWLRR